MNRSCLWIALAAALVVMISPSGLKAEDFKEIDVTINVYKNSGTTKAKAQEAVKKANEILKQAKIKLNVSDARTHDNKTSGDDGSGGGTAEDGKFNKDERKKIREAGSKEVDGGKKGVKIVFGAQPTSEIVDNPGVSVHKNPTVIVKDRGTAAKTAETLAHELLHALTLAEQYAITDTTNSDNHGHAPDQAGDAGNDNIMAPSNRRTGTKIKPKQTKKIEDDGYLDEWGNKKKKDDKASPGEKKDLQKGTAQDDTNEAASSHTDLSRIGMRSEVGNPFIGGVINLGGLMPAAGPINATYLLDFETNPGFGGFDQQLVINVSGDQSSGPLSVQGTLVDLAGGGGTTPVPVNLTTGISAVDLDVPEEAEESQLEFQLEKSLITVGPEPGLIPILALAQDNLLLSSEPDALNLEFDGQWFASQPDMFLYKEGTGMQLGQATPGDTIDIEIVQLSLTSSTPFDLFVDETLVGTGITDGSGGFLGDFVLPLDVELNDFYFITAIGADGTSAFNVLHTVPEPGALLLLAMVAGSVALRRRR